MVVLIFARRQEAQRTVEPTVAAPIQPVEGESFDVGECFQRTVLKGEFFAIASFLYIPITDLTAIDDTTLDLSTDGLLTGQAPAGVYNIPITVTSSNYPYVQPRSETLVVTITQVPGNPIISTTTLPNALVGMAYHQQILATGTAPVTFTATGLPAGLNMSTSGLITGTVTAISSNTVVITAGNAILPNATLRTNLNAVLAPSALTLTLRFMSGTQVADATVAFTALDLLAGSTYTLTLHSDPVIISSGPVDDTGTLDLSGIPIPAGTPAGAHSLILSATAADGTTVTSSAYFSILADGTIGKTSYIAPIVLDGLAHTGTDAMIPFGAGLVLLLAGLVLMLTRRRRLI